MISSIHEIFQKRLLILELALCLLVGIFLFKIVINPFYRESRILSGEILDKKDKLVYYKQLLLRQDAIKKEYADYFASSASSKDKNLTVSAFKGLEEIASKSLIKIIDIRYNKTLSGQLPEMLIELKAQGQEKDFVQFIYNLENSPLLFSIKSFNLKTKRGTVSLQARFLISKLSAP